MINTIRLFGALCATVAAMAFAPSAFAQATTYTLNSATYSTVVNGPATPCDIAPCATFTSAMRLTGSFVTSEPLPPDSPTTNIAPILVSYSFSDGVTTYSSSDPLVRLDTFRTATSGGAVSIFRIEMQRWNQNPHMAGPDSAATRFASIRVQNTYGEANYGLKCNNVGVSNSGVSDYCDSQNDSSDATSAYQETVSNTISVAAAAIPTLSEWAMILLGLTMAGGSALYIQRRRHEA